jgi:exodeoxyribonuclease VII large subunit
MGRQQQNIIERKGFLGDSQHRGFRGRAFVKGRYYRFGPGTGKLRGFRPPPVPRRISPCPTFRYHAAMATTRPLTPEREIFTVSQLNRAARSVLEGSFPLLWVEGEISNLARPTSGHWYLSLKDAQAQVRCAMFRNRNQLVRFRPEDGMQVLVRGRLSLYEARGDYQLIIEHMEEAGDGALRRAFEALKQRLAAEGLFAEEHKRPLPSLPRCIGLITSPTGAAIRDMLSVLARRFPAIPILLYPVAVQGEGAPAEIAAALHKASRRRDCDVLILARGGGSLEDLWAFNEEVVARAIHDCEIPVVSGVGHEVDVTIADFVADRRAATPSAAAELVTPDRVEWEARLDGLGQRMRQRIGLHLSRGGQHLQWLVKRLEQQHPGQRLRQRAQRLDELEQRLHRALGLGLSAATGRLAALRVRLEAQAPHARLDQLRGRCRELDRRLQTAMALRLERGRHRLGSATRALDTVSPLATLDRGYAIALTVPEGQVVRDAATLSPGDQLETRLHKGRLLSTVDRLWTD